MLLLDDLRSALAALRAPEALRNRLGFGAALCFLLGAAILFFRLLHGAIGEGRSGLLAALAVTGLLTLAAAFHLLLLFSRSPRPEPEPRSGLFDQGHFNHYAERFLEDRFGRTWRLLLAGASILTGLGLLLFNLDLYGFSKTKRALETELHGLRDRIAYNLRESTIFTTDTLGRVTAYLEKNRVAIADRKLRIDLQVDGFRLLEEKVELEFVLRGLVQREHRILRESLEGRKDRDWVATQRKALSGFVDRLASGDRERLSSPPAYRADFAEPHIWQAEALLRPVVPQRPDPELLAQANGELRRALDALAGAFYGEDGGQAEPSDSELAYRSFLRGKIAYLGGRVAFLTGRHCAELSPKSDADREVAICRELTEMERRLRSFVRRRELSVRSQPGFVPWIDGGARRARWLPQQEGEFREQADQLALDLLQEAEDAWHAADPEGGRIQPLLASIELWRGHLHHFAERNEPAQEAYEKAIRTAEKVGEASYPEAMNASAWARLTRTPADELPRGIVQVIRDAYSALEESDPSESSWYARHDTYARALSAAGFHYEAVTALYEGIGALRAVDDEDPRWPPELRRTRMQEHCGALFRTSLGAGAPSWSRSAAEAGNAIARALEHYAHYQAAARELGAGIDPEIAIKLARIHHIAGIRIETCADVLGEAEEDVRSRSLEHLCIADLLIKGAVNARAEDIAAQAGASAIADTLLGRLEENDEADESVCRRFADRASQVRTPAPREAGDRTVFLHRLRTRSDERLEHLGLPFPKARMLTNEAFKFRTKHGECGHGGFTQFEAAELAADAVTKRGFGGRQLPAIDSLLETLARVALCSPAHRTLGLAAVARAGKARTYEVPDGELSALALAAAYANPPEVGAGPPPAPAAPVAGRP